MDEDEKYLKWLKEEIDENYGYGKQTKKAIENMMNRNKELEKENADLQKSVDQIYEDYQDAGLRMFQYSETLDKVKEFANQKIHYKVTHKQGDELKNILMKEIVRQLDLYRKEILKIIKEGEKHG